MMTMKFETGCCEIRHLTIINDVYWSGFIIRDGEMLVKTTIITSIAILIACFFTRVSLAILHWPGYKYYRLLLYLSFYTHYWFMCFYFLVLKQSFLMDYVTEVDGLQKPGSACSCLVRGVPFVEIWVHTMTNIIIFACVSSGCLFCVFFEALRNINTPLLPRHNHWSFLHVWKKLRSQSGMGTQKLSKLYGMTKMCRCACFM